MSTSSIVFCVFLHKRNVICLLTFLQSSQDCFLLACKEGHEEIVRELLTKDKVDRNVVNTVRVSQFTVSLSTVS